MSEQLAIPGPDERIRVPVNHVWRVDDQVLLRLVVVENGTSHALPVFLTCDEALDLSRRLAEVAG